MTADWGTFYRAVCEQAGSLLTGIDQATGEAIQAAATTDVFWSDSLLATFEDFSVDDTRIGVEAALEVWRENVLEVLGDLLDLDRQAVRIDPEAVGRLTGLLESLG